MIHGPPPSRRSDDKRAQGHALAVAPHTSSARTSWQATCGAPARAVAFAVPAPFVTARNPVLSLFQSAAAALARRTTGSDPASHPLAQAAAQLAEARQPSR